jgi:hypothetical protein
MGKIIDRVRERERKAWWVTHARLVKESDAIKDAAWAAKQEQQAKENATFKAKLEAEGKKNVVVLQSGIAVFDDPEPSSVWWKFWR